MRSLTSSPLLLAMACLAGSCAFGSEPIPREGAPDASARDAGQAPRIDASFLVDAARPDAELPPLSDAGRDAGPPVLPDAGRDAGSDAAICVPETCDAIDQDCDGRIDEGAMCPCPVVDRAGQAYLFCDETRSWAAARASCELVGYTLAAIGDSAEDAFVYGQLAMRSFADAWIGLNDLVTEMSWVWIDGTPAVYEHWDDGEPNDGGSGEDCGVIMTASGRQSEWDDRGCGSERPYVCEAPGP